MEKILRTGRSGHDLVGFLHSMLLLALAMIGMAGLVYHTLAPQGVIARILGHVVFTHPVLSFIVFVGTLTTVLAARNQAATGRLKRGASETPLYFFVALGTFFAARILVYGTL